MAVFRVNVSFRNMRAGETVEIPDDELGPDGPWAGVMKWLRPADAPGVTFVEDAYVPPLGGSSEDETSAEGVE